MSQVDIAELAAIRARHPDEKIVFCSGMFDLTHPGHVLFFEDCKKHGGILVVGVGGDKNVKERKDPLRPVMNQAMRLKMVDSLKPVDYCFVTNYTSTGGHRLAVIDFILGNLRPNVYVINRDAFDIPYREELVKKHQVSLVILDRWCPPEFEHISTTGLINKIKESAK